MRELRGCELYFDCFSGIAGDMTLGALLDLGVPAEVVRAELAKLPVAGYRFSHQRVRRGALVGTKVAVLLTARPPGRGPDESEDPTTAARAARETHGPSRHPHEAHHADSHEHHHHAEPHEHHHHAEPREHHHAEPREHHHAEPHEHHHAEPHEHHHAEPHEHHHAEPHERHHAEPHEHRPYRQIRQMLLDRLEGDVQARALAIFDRIAAVEARLHGMPVEAVAFHEVGAVDSIVDIVGAAAALAWLAPSRITCRPVPLGGGFIQTAHGRLPVPAPATLELLTGAAVEAGGDFELTTPTGAAIVAASASAFGPLPPFEVLGVGWGAGDRDPPDRPNLLRVVAGRPVSRVQSDEMVVVEANVDDMNPELCAPLLEALFAAGAVDAWFTPIVMKKSRPALTVAALCPPAVREAVVAALLRESTSIGARLATVTRTVLPRRTVEVSTPFGPVPVKVAGDDELGNAAPEYEACLRLARAAGVPVKRVYAAALVAFFAR